MMIWFLIFCVNKWVIYDWCYLCVRWFLFWLLNEDWMWLVDLSWSCLLRIWSCLMRFLRRVLSNFKMFFWKLCWVWIVGNVFLRNVLRDNWRVFRMVFLLFWWNVRWFVLFVKSINWKKCKCVRLFNKL